jgi:RNA polymerase sigma-70 factor (ECF subfamily)
MEDRRNTVQPTDQMLLERVARRDLPALETLYDRYSAAALGLAMRMVGERNRAEEIIQKAFWQVWKRADKCMGRGGEFSSWLFSIAHHLAIEELRRQRSGLLSTSMDVKDENVLDFPASSVDIAQVAPQTPDSAQIRGAFMELL